MERYAHGALTGWLSALYRSLSLGADDAQRAAAVLVETNLVGVDTHGLAPRPHLCRHVRARRAGSCRQARPDRQWPVARHGWRAGAWPDRRARRRRGRHRGGRERRRVDPHHEPLRASGRARRPAAAGRGSRHDWRHDAIGSAGHGHARGPDGRRRQQSARLRRTRGRRPAHHRRHRHEHGRHGQTAGGGTPRTADSDRLGHRRARATTRPTPPRPCAAACCCRCPATRGLDWRSWWRCSPAHSRA